MEKLESIISKRSKIEQPYKYVSGGRVLKQNNKFSPDPFINYAWDNYSWNSELQVFVISPKKISAYKGRNFFIKDGNELVIYDNGSLIIDFGCEYPGWLEVDSPDLNGDITFAISEHKQPTFANKDAVSTDKTKAPVKHGDTYRLELNKELYEGVRFAFINISNLHKPFTITEIRLVCHTKPINYKGEFRSSNNLLNKIWYASAYVVRANLLNNYFCSILNERGDRISWTGDAYTAQAAALVAFGNYDFVYENLKFTESHPNGIATYELYWILSIVDYYLYSEDKTGVRKLLPFAEKRLEEAYGLFDNHPNLLYVGWDERLGAGFEVCDLEEGHNVFKMVALRAFKEFSEVLESIGEHQKALKYREYYDKKVKEISTKSNWFERFGIHAVADAINADMLSQKDAKTLYHKYFDDRVNRISYSPFNEYFLLWAMGKLNHHDDALSAIYDMWGGMINYGATTLFEVYRPEWNDVICKNGAVPNCQVGYTSMAHPWGAGVLKWLSEEILGIKPLINEFASFQIKPHLGRMLTSVSGSTPTKHGKIRFSIDVNKGTAKLVVPRCTICSLYLPQVEKTIQCIQTNNEFVNFKEQDDDFVYLGDFTPGTYEFKISFEGETPKYVELKREYRIKNIEFDRETKGDWLGKYGKEGYFLCGYNPKDVAKLPNFIESINFPTFRLIVPYPNEQWCKNSHSKAALCSPDSNVKVRKLGVYRTHKFQNCGQCMVFDIKLKEKRKYKISLYFCDWDKQGRRLTIDTFDGDTLELIAPVKMVEKFGNGVYVTFEYDNSIRFRLNAVTGDNAPLSAIFFD